ncbi:MAG TPA: phosphatidylserine decarboxylase family protein [Pyrinomonadaceae bacterium]|nr:phosphatidylserine decarboxylase family protein [Pyrinomonadaceae bacterium]
MVKDGILWILIPALAALAAALFGLWWVAIPLLLLAAFMAYFFRDPNRVVPDDEALVVSPADGRVTRVEKLSEGDAQTPTVVSIFLSPFDVHVNRSPIAGRVIDRAYTKGRFMIATKDEASLVNEQNALTIEGERITVVCKQIAGVLARRIVCWKGPGDVLQRGERFGLIKFSSRTDLVLPPEVSVSVSVGDRVRGGVSVIGRINDGS